MAAAFHNDHAPVKKLHNTRSTGLRGNPWIRVYIYRPENSAMIYQFSFVLYLIKNCRCPLIKY